jgi:hypothetical protein
VAALPGVINFLRFLGYSIVILSSVYQVNTCLVPNAHQELLSAQAADLRNVLPLQDVLV